MGTYGQERMLKCADGLRVLAKYENGGVTAEHDQLFAGPEGERLDVITPEDVAELERLGWYVSSDIKRYYFNT